MHTATRYGLAALLLIAVATWLTVTGLTERRLAEADRALVTDDLSRAAGIFTVLRTRLQPTERVPWLLRDTRAEIEAGHARTRYWRGEHTVLVAEYPDLGSEVVRNSPLLQVTVANAHIRVMAADAGNDRPALLNSLDRAIGLYQQVLHNTGGHRNAAYNYELLVRWRDEIAAGEEVPALAQKAPVGTPGSSGEDEMDMLGDMNDIQIYVPSDMLGRESTDEPTIGSDAPIRRRG